MSSRPNARTVGPLALAVFLLAASAFGQMIDPKTTSSVVLLDAVTTTSTSSPYAVVCSVLGWETVYLTLSTPDSATGTLVIQGTIDSEAAVLADAADWFDLTSTTTMRELLYVSEPLSYLRVVWTRTSGTLTVKLRGMSTKFRKVL